MLMSVRTSLKLLKARRAPVSEIPIIRITPEVKLWPLSMTAVIRKAAHTAYASAKKPKWLSQFKVEISVTLTNDRRIRKINKLWLGKDKPTNVLSFPQIDATQKSLKGVRVSVQNAPLLLGDVILAYETIAREAKAENKTLKAHVNHMVAHGVLHLLGFDHIYEKDALRMERLECDILAKLGYADPYSLRVKARK